MAGIVFFRTNGRDRLVEWYLNRVDASVWLEQPGCTILSHEGFRFGFCDADETETEGILTFVYETRTAVETMHDRLGEAVREEPHYNDQYDIYQFFAADPDGRTVEIQTFEHETPEI
jgi:hypothetical protein